MKVAKLWTDLYTVLFRASMRCHERPRVAIHRDPEDVHAEHLRHWFPDPHCERHGRVPSQRFSCLLGKSSELTFLEACANIC